MPRHKPIDVPLLFRLWADTTLTRAEVARGLGVTETRLALLVRRHKLPARGHTHRSFPTNDPTPEEIAERARECRERHMAQRREEDACNTYSKISKWRRGICQPGGERHAG